MANYKNYKNVYMPESLFSAEQEQRIRQIIRKVKKQAIYQHQDRADKWDPFNDQ